jgi:hypothetical protein
MDFSEFDYNIAEGEFSTKTEGKTVSLILGEDEYKVYAIVSRKYARKEVDGRFTTDLPTFTLSVIISVSQIPTSISEEDYRLLNVKVDDVTYAVRYVTGTGVLTLTLKPLDGEEEEPDESDDSEDSEDSEDDGVV